MESCLSKKLYIVEALKEEGQDQISHSLAVFTLETDYPSETGYGKFENGTVLIWDEQSSCPYTSVCPSILTDFDGLSVASSMEMAITQVIVGEGGNLCCFFKVYFQLKMGLPFSNDKGKYFHDYNS